MDLKRITSKVASEAGGSTACTALTPPSTICPDPDDRSPACTTNATLSSSVPWPNSTYIIRCATTGDVLTFYNGQLSLSPLGGRGAIHWACIDTKGWLGFRNLVTGRYLGYDGHKHGKLRCSTEKHPLWERFCVRLRPNGGYVLLVTHYEKLWPVGTKVER
ncbi:hypothetical protein H2200_008827 [Cladophialophora chaetospira]|uniref:Uncharacterized protein n=1 Tax=Cladophialophora chaetospira TaxID=386627 RepID=A0AA39CG32_9EURO|nr:hypothetical protein H2200_008827 [Cladophialophora chaetospira]